MRTTYYALMLLILALLSAGCQTIGKKGEESPSIDVMSFNIRYGLANDGENSWEHRKGLVCDVIGRHSADIIGLQEALRFQIDEIIKCFPQYGMIGLGRDGDENGEYSAILYRTERFDVDASNTFWLSDTPAVPSAHWGNNYLRICTWARLVDLQSGAAFYIYNTHLDHESQSSREKSVRLIAQFIQERAHQDPVVLTGDFNAGEDNPAITYLTGKGVAATPSPIPVADTFRLLHPDEKDVGTFNSFREETNGPKIDYIFVSPDIRSLDASIVRTAQDGRYPSDHFPVTARVRLVTDR